MRGSGGCTTTHSSTEGRGLLPLINEVMAKNAVRTMQDADKTFGQLPLTLIGKGQVLDPKGSLSSKIFGSGTHRVNKYIERKQNKNNHKLCHTK